MGVQDYGLGGPAASLVNATIIGLIVCLILVSNRIFWRVKIVRAIRADDYLILLSLCFLMMLGGTSLAAVDSGYGRAQSDLSAKNTEKTLLLFFFYQIVYKLNISLTKLSVISLYLRIFRDIKWFRMVCLSTGAIIILYTSAAVTVNIFQCHPISHAWSHHTQPPPSPSTATASQGICINIPAFWLTTAIVNLTTELTILLASIFVVIKLDLPSRQKIALLAILALGTFVFITSILRVMTLHPFTPTNTNTTTAPTAAKVDNTTQSTYLSTLWSTIEATIAISCACLPMLRTPIQRYLPRIFGSLRTNPRSGPRSHTLRHNRDPELEQTLTDPSPPSNLNSNPEEYDTASTHSQSRSHCQPPSHTIIQTIPQTPTIHTPTNQNEIPIQMSDLSLPILFEYPVLSKTIHSAEKSTKYGGKKVPVL